MWITTPLHMAPSQTDSCQFGNSEYSTKMVFLPGLAPGNPGCSHLIGQLSLAAWPNEQVVPVYQQLNSIKQLSTGWTILKLAAVGLRVCVQSRHSLTWKMSSVPLAYHLRLILSGWHKIIGWNNRLVQAYISAYEFIGYYSYQFWYENTNK